MCRTFANRHRSHFNGFRLPPLSENWVWHMLGGRRGGSSSGSGARIGVGSGFSFCSGGLDSQLGMSNRRRARGCGAILRLRGRTEANEFRSQSMPFRVNGNGICQEYPSLDMRPVPHAPPTLTPQNAPTSPPWCAKGAPGTPIALPSDETTGPKPTVHPTSVPAKQPAWSATVARGRSTPNTDSETTIGAGVNSASISSSFLMRSSSSGREYTAGIVLRRRRHSRWHNTASRTPAVVPRIARERVLRYHFLRTLTDPVDHLP